MRQLLAVTIMLAMTQSAFSQCYKLPIRYVGKFGGVVQNPFVQEYQRPVKQPQTVINNFGVGIPGAAYNFNGASTQYGYQQPSVAAISRVYATDPNVAARLYSEVIRDTLSAMALVLKAGELTEAEIEDITKVEAIKSIISILDNKRGDDTLILRIEDGRLRVIRPGPGGGAVNPTNPNGARAVDSAGGLVIDQQCGRCHKSGHESGIVLSAQTGLTYDLFGRVIESMASGRMPKDNKEISPEVQNQLLEAFRARIVKDVEGI